MSNRAEAKIAGLLAALDIARDTKRAKLEASETYAHGGELQVQELMALLLVSRGSEDGTSEWRPVLQRDAQQRLGVTTATMSRIISRLSGGAKGSNAPGLGLIEKRNSPTNEAVNELRLTPRGRALVAKFAEALS
ncbi:MAG: hypothetical protein INH37_13690 [Myxococcaceae bacterium]|nr:hypothetical protein [Myxococcaceae bacterium]